MYMESKPKFMCRTASYFHCVQNTTSGGANSALQQNRGLPGELQAPDGSINIHELTGNIMDSEM